LEASAKSTEPAATAVKRKRIAMVIYTSRSESSRSKRQEPTLRESKGRTQRARKRGGSQGDAGTVKYAGGKSNYAGLGCFMQFP